MKKYLWYLTLQLQFCYYIQKDEEKRRATMHIPRKPSEQIEVDWVGDPAHIIDLDTGEITDARIFVVVLTYSQYAFVRAYMNEKKYTVLRIYRVLFDKKCERFISLKGSDIMINITDMGRCNKMTKDLTTSRIDRQNILNNEMALDEVRTTIDIGCVFWNEKYYMTKEMVASYFDVDIRTVERYISNFSEELNVNGFEILKGKKLQEFIAAYDATFATDINVGRKIRALSVFDFRAFLDMAMLLAESEKARALRQLMLDIVIDLINRKTGGGTKYINQRDKDFIFSSLQEDNYRRQFTDALKKYVENDRYKYAYFTDLIYVSIFKEKAKEYKKILDLKASDKARDTFYSEILDIIAAYESGLADALKSKYEELSRVLTRKETEEVFCQFENMALWKPLIHRGRVKMASRDMALRDAFHYQLAEYIQPLDKDEYQKFLGATGDELEKLMIENQDVLKRLKERD